MIQFIKLSSYQKKQDINHKVEDNTHNGSELWNIQSNQLEYHNDTIH